MDVRAQVSMVFHLDKCIGCHTCSIACKNVWTDRKGAEYMWWNNVETKPGTGYPTAWEDQEKYKGGWEKVEGGVQVRAVNSAWTEGSITLGSGRIVDLKKPKIAVAAYPPVTGRSYGALWFELEQMLDLPFTPIRTEQLRTADLTKYNVIIFPDGNDGAYQEILGTAGIARLKSWIEAGGVFVGLKGGAAFATRKGVEWTTSRVLAREEGSRRGAAAEQAAKPDAAQEKEKQAPPEKPVERTPGAIVRLEVNPGHFLAYGYEPEQAAMHNSALIFTPSREGTNVASYAKQNPRLSGFIWPDTEKRLAGSAYLVDENIGRGHAILFADDPLFRLQWPRLTRLFLGAVYFAPSLQ